MNPNRGTSVPTALSINNIVCRGSTSDWQALYRELSNDPELRRVASRILRTADIEAAPGAITLFQKAIDDMNGQLDGRGYGTPAPDISRSIDAKVLR